MKKIILIAVLLLIAAAGYAAYMKSRPVRVSDEKIETIDDFSGSTSAGFGGEWKFFSDGVMGGKSRGEFTLREIDGRSAGCLRGRVVPRRGNGFIVASLSLKVDGKFYNASDYKGIRIEAKGNGEEYFLHLKTKNTAMHWQLYRAPFTAGDSWSEIEIPFTGFEALNLDAGLDTGAMSQVAIAASDRKFAARVCVSEMSFYK